MGFSRIATDCPSSRRRLVVICAPAIRGKPTALCIRMNQTAVPPSSLRRGKLFVIAAPSGAGKTSLVKALLERLPELHVSVSNTTRQRRPTEEHGREDYFVSGPELQGLVEGGG